MTFSRREFNLGSGAVLTGLLGAACEAQTVISPASARPDSLKAIANSRGLKFGSSLKGKQIGNKALMQLFIEECDVIVAENAFKWKHMERDFEKYDFKYADLISNFAKKNDLYLRGHTVVWNQDNRIPQWMLEVEPELGKGGPKMVRGLIARHLRKMQRRYPHVQSWDVVNESVQLQDGAVRDSFYTRVLGETFGDFAFQKARDIMPNTELVYNDYMQWSSKPDHRDGVLKYLTGMVERGIPVDALGIQSHIAGSVGDVDETAWVRFMDDIKALGLNVIITELDCGDSKVMAGDIARRDAETAAHVKAYLDITLDYANVKQVVLWGLTDLGTYANSRNYPEPRRRPDGQKMRLHPYDVLLKEKPMRSAIAQALKAAPKR